MYELRRSKIKFKKPKKCSIKDQNDLKLISKFDWKGSKANRNAYNPTLRFSVITFSTGEPLDGAKEPTKDMNRHSSCGWTAALQGSMCQH